MAGFLLSENPFCVLRVSPRASIQEIEDAFEDAVIENPSDEQMLLRLKQELLTPNARLSAEMSWLTEIAPRRASDILESLVAGDAKAVGSGLADMPPLAAANVAADALQRLADIKFLAPVITAHRRIRIQSVVEWINSTRSAAGFGQVEVETVAVTLRTLRTRHAASAVHALVVSGAPSQALTALLADCSDSHDPFLREVMREFDQWSSPHLAEIAGDITLTLTEVKADRAGAVETLCKHLKAWDELSQPAQAFAQLSGLDEERSLRIYRTVRSECIDLANEQARYIDAQRIAAVMRDLFRELPTAVAELDNDLATLGGLVDQAELATLLEPLQAAISRARSNIREFTADLLRHGFVGDRGGNTLRELHAGFVSAVAVLAPTNHADVPIGLLRGFALELNNEDNEPAAALALSEGLLEIATPSSAELADQLATDLRVGRNNEAYGRLTSAIAAKRFKDAAHIVAGMLTGPLDDDDRSQLRLVQERIQQQRNRRLVKMVGWGAAALFVIYLVVQNGGSPSPQSPTATQDVDSAASTAQGAAATAADAAASASAAASAAADGAAPTVEPPAPAPSEVGANTADVSTPPVGAGLALEPAQIRYCVFEKLRLTEMQNLVSGGSSNVVDRFNTRVEDYNSRCGNYRYRSGDLEAANAMAASVEQRLKAEAQATVQDWTQ